MEYLHQELNLGTSDAVEVTLDHAANVQLLDSSNFDRYRQNQPYQYHGGYVTQSPYRLNAPHAGQWHLVIDLGGNAGQVRAWTKVLKGADVLVGG